MLGGWAGVWLSVRAPGPVQGRCLTISPPHSGEGSGKNVLTLTLH